MKDSPHGCQVSRCRSGNPNGTLDSTTSAAQAEHSMWMHSITPVQSIRRRKLLRRFRNCLTASPTARLPLCCECWSRIWERNHAALGEAGGRADHQCESTMLGELHQYHGHTTAVLLRPVEVRIPERSAL